MRVVEAFQITGRGLAAIIAESTRLPVGKKLAIVVTRPDGTQISAEAFKEFLLRRNPSPVETEVLLLAGLSQEDVPIGSEIALNLLV